MKYPDPYYKTARWQRLRERVLRRDGYLCQVSKRYGKRVEATTVHHVFPREEFPEYEWAPWNLVSLAGNVHDELHDRTTGALTEKGVETTLEAVEAEMKSRDHNDSTRKVAPAIPAADAVMLDNSELDREGTVEAALAIIAEKLA